MGDLSSSLQAALTFKLGDNSSPPDIEELSQQLFRLEKQGRKQRISFPLQELLGEWNLLFITSSKSVKSALASSKRKGRFIPHWLSIRLSFAMDSAISPLKNSPEEIDPAENNVAPQMPPFSQVAGQSKQAVGQIKNNVRIGAISLILTGPFSYNSAQNILAFDFLELTVQAGARSLLTLPIRGGKAAAAKFWEQPLKEQAFFRYFLVTSEVIAARGRGGGIALWGRDPSVYR